MILRRLPVLGVVLAWALALEGAEPAGDLYQIGIALNQSGIRGHWRQIGKAGAWNGVVAGAILNRRLFTVESDGSLRATELETGERVQIAGQDFGETIFMFASVDSLWTIERNGTLYRVNPADGGWSAVGTEGAWIETRAGAILKGRLYTAQSNGTLQETNLGDGTRKQIGPARFADTAAMMAGGDKLWIIDTHGNLQRVDPQSGAGQRVGPQGEWKSLLGAAIVDDRLYSIRDDGTLREAILGKDKGQVNGKGRKGKGRQLGKAEFGNTRFLYASRRQLYTIENDGSLYEVFLRPEEDIDGWDCFPREFEKVFQEQAREFYRQRHARLVLGKRATLASIREQFAWLRSQATANDMVVFYWGSHGGTDPEQGWGAETADGETLWGHEVKRELAKLPCHALVFIETCGSGGFDRPHKDDPPVPANVTALCACSDGQSASNELDIAALEGLWGRADFNGDETVELNELLRYVQARYQVMFPGPDDDGELIRPVMVEGKRTPGSLRLTRVSRRLGAVAHEGWLYSALVNEHEGDNYQVHILGYNNRPGPYFITNAAQRDCVCLPGDGPPLEVEQNGTWYPARLVAKVDGNRFKVHYLGYDEEEVVTRQRMRQAFVPVPHAEKRLGK